MTRKEKIELLKGIAEGRISLDVLRDQISFFGYNEDDFFVNTIKPAATAQRKKEKQIPSGEGLQFTYGPEQPI